MKVGIVMGSISDKHLSDKIIEVLKDFGVEYELNVISAHRTPDAAFEYAKNLYEKGIAVVIAIAGKAAHLAGVIAGIATEPVIGVPAKSSTLDGLDSLLSVVQMPGGVPVATVAVDGAVNAALLAVQMLAISDDTLKAKMIEYKQRLKDDVARMNEQLN